jgi:hypothetical protein
MRKQQIGMMIACALFAVASMAQTQPAKKAPAAKAASGGPVTLGSEQWMDIPAAAIVGTPAVEMGGTWKIAILQGDPMTAGHSYTVRLSCTDGAKFAPHFHPATENVTVLKGSLLLGMGSKWDDAAMKEIPVGGFVSAPPLMRHYVQCRGEGVLQVNGVGPLVINFVGPDDNGPGKK